MGWAVRRSDGSYRAWNGIPADIALNPGEVWEELPTIPEIRGDPMPRPRAFRQALLERLDGASRAAKLARAQNLRERAPGLTEPFLMALAGATLSADEADIIVAIWGRIRALAGTPGEVLTAAEISRIEALAPTYLIRLL